MIFLFRVDDGVLLLSAVERISFFRDRRQLPSIGRNRENLVSTTREKNKTHLPVRILKKTFDRIFKEERLLFSAVFAETFCRTYSAVRLSRNKRRDPRAEVSYTFTPCGRPFQSIFDAGRNTRRLGHDVAAFLDTKTTTTTGKLCGKRIALEIERKVHFLFTYLNNV